MNKIKISFFSRIRKLLEKIIIFKRKRKMMNILFILYSFRQSWNFRSKINVANFHKPSIHPLKNLKQRKTTSK